MGLKEWLGLSKPKDAPGAEFPKIDDNGVLAGGEFQ